MFHLNVYQSNGINCIRLLTVWFSWDFSCHAQKISSCSGKMVLKNQSSDTRIFFPFPEDICQNTADICIIIADLIFGQHKIIPYRRFFPWSASLPFFPVAVAEDHTWLNQTRHSRSDPSFGIPPQGIRNFFNIPSVAQHQTDKAVTVEIIWTIMHRIVKKFGNHCIIHTQKNRLWPQPLWYKI